MKKSKSKKIIIKKCGLERDAIESKLRFAKNNGMKYKRFLLNRAWELSNEEIINLNKKIDDYMNIKDDELHLLKLKTGVLKEQIVARKFLVNKYGIGDKTYFERRIYLMSERDFEKYLSALITIKNNKEKDKEFYINVLKDRKNWSLQKCRKEIEEAEKKGIESSYYLSNGVYEQKLINDEKIIYFIKNDKANIKKNAKEYFDKICNVTKWPIEKVELKTRISKALTGCSYEDYYCFKFYKLNDKKQKEYITLNNFKKMRIKYNEHHKSVKFFDNKDAFNEKFKKYINRTWFLNTDLTFDNFIKYTTDLNEIFVKPIASTRGLGIKKINISKKKSELKKVYDELVSMPKSIVEECILQHNDMMEFCDKSVNTVRIATLNNNGKCEFLYAVFRMGQGHIVDNFHAGGIAATIDVKTGKVVTNASDLEGNIFKKNIYSGKKIKGFKIPYWDKIIETCEKIYNLVDDVNLIGWDFAITDDGVELIEGNPGVSYVVAQIPNVQIKKGLNYIMAEKYLL